jgi:hypothetical protein
MTYSPRKLAWTGVLLILAGALHADSGPPGPAGAQPPPPPSPSPPSPPITGSMSYSGAATALGTERFIYGEEHFMRFQNGRIAERVVLYKCQNGAPFARKHLSYANALAPDFDLLDVSSGMHEGVRPKTGGREIFFRESYKDKETTGPLPDVPGLVGDAGFDEFVRANWAPLMAGEKRRLDFVVPSRLDVIGFQVRHIQSDTVSGFPAEMFRLRLSGFLGLLLPSIDVYYSSSDRVLLRYDGLSNLHDASGSIYKAHIVFPPASRHLSDDQAMHKALEARLLPCR